MADDGERYTDKEFEKLKRLLERTYEQAGKELQEKLEKKLRSANKDLDKLYKKYQESLTKGVKKESKRLLAEYKEGLAKSMTEGNWYKEAVDLMAEELTHVNERALAYTQDRTPKVYEYNQKYTQNEVSKELAGYNFHLKDEQTVKNLTKRLTAKSLNLSKDKRWNSKRVNAQLLQGILQGESIPDIAKRIERVTKDTYKASLRTARTMMTGAQNEGRHDRATQLAQQGLLMKKVWIATGDDRVRTTHLDADGQEVELDEPFNVGGEELQYPADPVGSPAEVYNCRCKYSNRVVGFIDENGITHMFDIEHEEGLHQQQINAERERRNRLTKEKAKKEEAKQEEKPKNPDNLKTSVIDVIGYPSSPKSQEDAMREVNPHRDDWITDPNVAYQDYRWNCQRCAPAYELSRRGYDVEAKKFDGVYNGWMDVFKTDGYAKDVENWVSNSANLHWTGNPSRWGAPADTLRLMGRGPKGATKTIKEAMGRWGEGSRAVMCVWWKGGGGHIVNVENVGGKVVIYDSQVNKSTEDIEGYLKRTVANHTELCRVDHLKIREEMNEKFKSVVKKREHD